MRFVVDRFKRLASDPRRQPSGVEGMLGDGGHARETTEPCLLRRLARAQDSDLFAVDDSPFEVDHIFHAKIQLVA